MPNYATSVGICIFNKFIIDATIKGYTYPIKIKINLAKIFSWFGILIISHTLRKIKQPERNF